MYEFSRRIVTLWKQRVSPRILPLLSTIGIAGLLLSMLALWIFAKIAEDVWEKETFAFDSQILLSLHRLHRPFLDRLLVGVTFLGEPSVLLIVGLFLSGWFLWRHLRAEAVTLAIAAVGTLGLNFVLKDLFARARPALWERVVDVRYYSFPSGHAMMSMVIYGLLGYLLISRYPNRRYGIAALTILLILAIGFSRLYLGVHWPTDIIAGYAAGFLWLVACTIGLEVWRRHTHSLRSTSPGRSRSSVR